MAGPVSKKRKATELSSPAVQPPKSKSEQPKPEKSDAPTTSKAETSPLEPLETLVAAYLQERKLNKTLKAFEKETSKSFDAKTPATTLQTIYETYQKDNTSKTKPINGVSDAAAAMAAQIRSGMSKVAEKVAPKKDESDKSDESSEDESSEDDESDTGSDEDEESSEESESEESSAESESETDSESEVDQRPTKKRVQEIKGRTKALPAQQSESSSSSSSESESDSDSNTEPPTNGLGAGITTNGVSDKMDVDEDTSSSSSSSESEAEPAAVPEPVNGHAKSSAVPNGTPTTAQKRAPVEEAPSPADYKRQKKTNEPFSRIPKDQAVDPRFASNKYNSYDYAERAHADLIVTKGKGFTKEKNKKKKGSYRGGIIDIGGGKAVKFD